MRNRGPSPESDVMAALGVFGVNRLRYSLVRFVIRNPGVTTGEICDALHVQRTTLTRPLKILTDAGIVVSDTTIQKGVAARYRVNTEKFIALFDFIRDEATNTADKQAE